MIRFPPEYCYMKNAKLALRGMNAKDKNKHQQWKYNYVPSYVHH